MISLEMNLKPQNAFHKCAKGHCLLISAKMLENLLLEAFSLRHDAESQFEYTITECQCRESK